MELVFFIILGALVGSFLNAVIYRLHANQPIIKDRSKCPKCKHKLTWFELIPIVSFVIQTGKCRTCKQAISWQYPLVELATALLFGLVFYLTQSQGLMPVGFWQDYELAFFYVQVARGLVFVSFLIIIFVYDLKHFLILDQVAIPAMVLALGFNALLNPNLKYILFLLLAGAVAGGFFLFQYGLSKGKWIGGGDIRLGFLMGLILGWPDVVMGLVLAYIIGAIFGIGLLITKKKQLNSQIAFGTFLTLGTLIAFFWTDSLYQWYVHYLYNLI